MRLKDMKIVTKVSLIIAAFSLLAALLIAVGAFGISSNQKRVSAVLDDQEQSLYLGALAGEKKTRIHQEAFELALETDPALWSSLQKNFDDEVVGLDKLLTELRPLMDGEDLRNYQRIEAAKTRYAELESKLNALRTTGDAHGAQALVQGEMTQVFKTMDDAFDKLIAKQDNDMDAAAVEIAAQSKRTLTHMVLIGVLGLIGAVSGGVALATLQISRPVTGLTDAMMRLAKGDLKADIPGLGRRDEVGRMADALGVFKKEAIAKIDLERVAEDQRQSADSAREAHTAAQAAAQRSQQQVVDALAQGLGRLAGGDLVARLDQAFPPEYERLRADFNAAVSKLQDALQVVSQSATTIRSGAGEISHAADDLSRRTEQQAASLEETAAALDQITATVRRTAEGSTHARKVVGDARADADRSRQIVQEAVGAMSGIEESSREIGLIIGVIDEIAFQTNLLALNAGVEAARAGEAGRGFAVVASEVRALAQRSADAAKQIKGLINSAGGQVSDGVELVRNAGHALELIMDKVLEINTVVSEIALSAQEQAVGLGQVNTAVNQMDQVTQQNAAMVEQTTAASRSLTNETQELVGQIGAFRIGGEQAPRRSVRAAA